MPPAAIKSIRDLIHWQYAKIIADSAGMGKRNYGFVMSKFKKLQGGEIFWDEIREYVKEREKSDECIFCGAKGNLTMDHLHAALPQRARRREEHSLDLQELQLRQGSEEAVRALHHKQWA